MSAHAGKPEGNMRNKTFARQRRIRPPQHDTCGIEFPQHPEVEQTTEAR